MTGPVAGSAEILAALAKMTADERREWVAEIESASVNLSNAAYAFAGNVPDAQPDPDTWAAPFLWLGAYQLDHALERIPTQTPATIPPVEG